MFVRRPRHAAYSVQSPYMWVKRAVVGAAFVSFAGLIWYVTSNRDTLETENLNPPLIQAPISPIKERSMEPGGMEIPNQDKEVFNLLDSTSEEDAGDVSRAVEASRAKPSEADNLADVAPEKVAEKVVTHDPEPASAPVPVQAPKPAVVEAVKAPEPAKTESFTNKIAAERQKPVTAKQEPAVAAPQEPAKGEWAVQLGSYTAEDAALKGVKIFQDKFPELLTGLTPVVKMVKLEKGTYHRVYFTGLASKSASADLCAKFKQKNQACLNVKQ
ncbi:MAG: hypothetical protein GC134_01560 [Proteobacteria bacterium]|nr:hypothetical protein [Pseudomonadota bacterium]